MKTDSCNCSDKVAKTVLSCSGAADLGLVSDKVARKLHANGVCQMKCLAFVSAGIEHLIDSIRDSNILVIDGCPADCGKVTLDKNGLANYTQLRLTDLGFEKGKTEINDKNIDFIFEKAKLTISELN